MLCVTALLSSSNTRLNHTGLNEGATVDVSSDGLLFIGGELRPATADARFDVIDPSDESLVGRASDAGVEDVDAAVTAARHAFDTSDWARDHELRKRCLRQLHEGLRKEADGFKSLNIAEAGLCASAGGGLIDSAIEEITYVIDLIDAFAWRADHEPYQFLGMNSFRSVRYEPYGVVGAITAWNAPTVLNLWKCIPALATGNTVVLKTAPETPLAGTLLARVVAEHTDIPPGVFNVITSSDNAVAGDGLTGDPRVDMFHFTGSSGVGERIAARAAVGIRKVVLELGGKSANIVLDDADLDAAVPFSTMMCMLNSGQGCTAATRMVVHASRYDETVERLREAVAAAPMGDPRDEATIVGPIIRADQVDRMDGLVRRAAEQGARVVVGGKRPDRDKGFWYEPTLVVDVDENSELAQTEVFGPVLSVLRYEGDDNEAIRIANNTPYGLSGYIQTTDQARGLRIAERLRTGTVSVNNAIHNSPQTPFGGYGRSGVGREHGIEGFAEFLQAKTIATPA
jgi:aldehyde dehydrogenase (NAD+)